LGVSAQCRCHWQLDALELAQKQTQGKLDIAEPNVANLNEEVA
jgi:hypothetical protein